MRSKCQSEPVATCDRFTPTASKPRPPVVSYSVLSIYGNGRLRLLHIEPHDQKVERLRAGCSWTCSYASECVIGIFMNQTLTHARREHVQNAE